MSAPYTAYPDPADNPYLVGVPCPFCGVGASERCMTSGGNVYGELCHKKRKEEARAQGVELTIVKPPTNDPPVDQFIPDKIGTLKLAFWFIEKSGGVERARAYFEAAVRAVSELPEK